MTTAERLEEIRLEYLPRGKAGEWVYPSQACPDIWFLLGVIEKQRKLITRVEFLFGDSSSQEDWFEWLEANKDSGL